MTLPALPRTILIPVAVLAGLVILYGAYAFSAAYRRTTKALAVAEARLAEIEPELQQAYDESDRLRDELQEEKDRVDDLAEQIEDLTGTVGTLEKLAKTDPELLQKYSKVYFLNENYTPPRLSAIDDELVLAERGKLQIHAAVEKYLENMIEDAADDGVDLKVVSAYRSFGTQSALKSGYTVTYGSLANKFSADQGYSEHQLGTTVDLTSPEQAAPFEGFQNTKAYKWLLDNAYRYGFILSYPANNAYYQFEPWHWRFVGVDLARYLDRKNLNFYDMDQRDIDKYLVSIFD